MKLFEVEGELLNVLEGQRGRRENRRQAGEFQRYSEWKLVSSHFLWYSP